MTTKIYAWDEVWRAVEEAGVEKACSDPSASCRSAGTRDANYGQVVVDRVMELYMSRLTSQQIYAIADLIRAVAKACRTAG